ncbi:hypothetical protein [Vibrio cholerae]|uniref:hypothetical protein n=1 Tax=Vibrio cholerae TaxID=666 RepID=UPI0011D78A1F|nr:hypothetical protein [Vibrio cholerae]MDX5049978.1 hypothetical protein [Vibrio cholerae]TXY78061.1 hypothetical protein FXE80_01505 [Vibrio cholerae]GIB17090.1 hypothetical protein VCSRO90_2892 [Vibrio cholerae]
MEFNPDAPVFNNWTVEELEAEMMECYSHIVSTPKDARKVDDKEAIQSAYSAMGVLNFMAISQVVPDSFKATLEPIHTEAKLRLDAINFKYTKPISKRMIETTFGKFQPTEVAQRDNSNACPECDEVDSLEPLYSGEVRCMDCGHAFYA